MLRKLFPIIVGMFIVAGCNQPESRGTLSGVDSAQSGTFEGRAVRYDPSVVDVAPASQVSWSPSPAQAAPAVTGTDSTYLGDETTGTRIHVVQPRDTLYGLARLYYNDARQWKAIYDANRHLISDPNKIKVGMKLIIP